MQEIAIQFIGDFMLGLAILIPISFMFKWLLDQVY